MRDFKLSQKFLEQFAGRQPDWGFGALSYATYKRTYARRICNDCGSYNVDNQCVECKSKNIRTEEFWETIRRVVEGTFTIQKRHCQQHKLYWDNKKAQRSAQTMFLKMWEFKFLPPGRGLWMMGTDAIDIKGGGGLNNCGFTSTENLEIDFSGPFCWAMDFLMLGVGVGFDTKGDGTIIIQEPAPRPEGYVFVIPDTREGWIEALKLTLEAFASGKPIPKYDYSQIREKGAPIKTFGGTSSGPDPLRSLLETVRALLTLRIDSTITELDIVDIMNYVGKAVVAGNVRRSAEIACGNPNSIDFIQAKDPSINSEALNDRRWASNNSILALVGMDYTRASRFTAKNGEPGYIWLENARMFGRMKDAPNNKDYRIGGFNPCLPDYTWVMTQDGPRQIKQLLDSKYIAIVNGKPYNASAFWHSGDKQIMRLELKSGRTLDLTDNHLVKMSDGTWKEAGNINIGESVKLNKHHSVSWGMSTYEEIMKGWLLGSLLGDGYINSSHNSAVLCYWGRDKYDLVDTAKNYLTKLGFKFTVTNIIERDEIRVESKDLLNLCNTFSIFDTQSKVINDIIRRQSSCFYSGFIAGYFDADGSIQSNKIKGNSLRITSVNLSNLKYIQDMLHSLGINSKIYQNRRNAGNRSLPDGQGGYKEYKCQATHELIITKSNILDFSFRIKLKSTTKNDKLHDIITRYKRRISEDDFTDKVVNIINDMGTVPVYDCTVDSVHEFDANGIRVHNCAEQGLEDKELCNLVETFPANHSSAEEFHDTLKYAFMYAKTVTLIMSHDPRTNSVMIRNRRIGTSMSGIEQAKKKFGIYNFYKYFCDDGYEVIKKYDRIYSEWLGIALSIKLTTVKPSGTVSLLAGATPGVHAAHSEFYYRTMRLAHDSPLVQALLNAGYRIELGTTEWKPEYEQDGPTKKEWPTFVVDHPIQKKIPDWFSGTVVAYFPVREKNFTKGKKDQTIWEQAENAAKMQYYWSDNSVSVTINMFEEEKHLVPTILEHYQTRMKTISFLPFEHGYSQAPYQDLTEEEYKNAIKNLKPIEGIETIGREIIDGYCESDRCEIRLPDVN